MRRFINAIWNFAIVTVLLCLISCSASKKVAQTSYLQPGIDIRFTGPEAPDSIFVTISPIPTDTTIYHTEYMNAILEGNTIAIPVADNYAYIYPDSLPSTYRVIVDNYALPPVYMRNSEHANINVSNFGPLKYEITDKPVVSTFPQYDEFYELNRKLWKLNRYKYSEEEFYENLDKMSSLLDTIMPQVNPETATYILALLDDDVVVRMFDKLPPNSRNTLYYTNLCSLRNSGALGAELQQKLESDLATNATVDLSVTGLDGTDFDISSLRGKWVVLDFWVSWCGPCRRGFEEMKKIYADNSDKLEVVAIACGDHEDVWKSLINELQLPWINLLAPSPEANEETVFGYPVPAFPTKIIIDPEGGMRDYIVGEDENFYTKLRNLLE